MAVPAHSKSRAPRTAPAEGRLFCSLAMAFTLGLAASVALGAEDAQTLAVTGTVFMDRNRNARQDPGEIGLAGALVSDGERFVETDQDGRYRLHIEIPTEVDGLTFVGRCSHVFLVNPPGTFFVTRHAWSLPSEPGGEFRADFGLRDASESEDGNFTVAHFGDSQFMTTGVGKLFTKGLKEMDRCDRKPAFILNNGDSVDDGTVGQLELFAGCVQDAGLRLPFLTAFGGHSALYGLKNQKAKPTMLFERYVGPMYYSFNYGGCHWIIFTGETYFLSTPHIQAQDRWIAADVARTPPDRPIVWVQHREYGAVPAAIEGRPVVTLLHGHWHLNARYTVDGVPVLATSMPATGGNSGEPAGFRVLTFRDRKLVGWEYRFFGIEQRVTLVTPARGATVDSKGFKVAVSAYDTSVRPARVEYFLDDDARGVPLDSRGDFIWTSPPVRLPAGPHSMRVRVTDSEGGPWPEVRSEFTVGPVSPPRPGAAWTSFGGGPAQTHQADADPDPPLHLAWCAPTGGSIGLSSPVVADGRVHIASQDFGQRPGRSAVFAFDAATGKELWRFPTERSVKHTVCLGDGKVFAYSTPCTLYAIDAATGEEVWRKSLGAPGYWNASWPPSYADGRVFVFDKSAKATAFDASSGMPLWQVQTEAPKAMWGVALSPAVAEGRVYFMDGAYDTETGEKLYEFRNTTTSSSAVMNGTYMGYVDGKLSGLDAAGGEVLWKSDLGGSPKVGLICSVAASPDGDVYVGQFGELVCYIPSETRERWRFSAKPSIAGLRTPRLYRSSMVVSTPAVSERWVYFGANDGRLYIVDRKSGAEAWSYEIGSPVGASPAVTGNALYAAAMDGCVYAFTAGKGD